MSPYSGDTGARCKRCLQEFEESEVDVVNVSPATELADIFLRDIGVEDINDLCPPMQGGTWCDGSAGVWGVGIVCVYNYGKRKNHKKAKGRIPPAEREEEA